MLIDRLSWAATTATVAFMFFAILWLQPMLAAIPTSYGLVGTVTGTITGAVASLGIYRLLSTGLLWLFGKARWIRKLSLGKGFLEGTWVGHYAHSGEHFFTIEHIDQASGQTRINGREFDASGKTRASWASGMVSVDTERMKLVYAYTCEVFHRKHVHEGLGVFTMVRESESDAPTKLDGYATDLIDGDRDPNTEIKISDAAIADVIALAKAKKLFGI
jgi:hypothetical protein